MDIPGTAAEHREVAADLNRLVLCLDPNRSELIATPPPVSIEAIVCFVSPAEPRIHKLKRLRPVAGSAGPSHRDAMGSSSIAEAASAT
jgi:hypothetical protein